MTTVLRVVDPDALSTSLWDFNNETGAGNPYGVKTMLLGDFDKGRAAVERSSFRPESHGETFVYGRHRLAEMRLRTRCFGVPYDDLRAGVGELARLLEQGGVMHIQEDGATEAQYADFPPHQDVVGLLRGQDLALYKVLRLLADNDGLPVLILRQPYLRGPELDPATNKAHNPLLFRDSDGNGRPDDWGWDTTANITNESIDAVRSGYKFDIATSAGRYFRETTLDTVAAPGEVWIAALDTERISGGSARANARIEFLDSGNVVLATANGTLTTLTGASQRLSVLSAAAPASTAKVRMGVNYNNTDAVSNTVVHRFPQLEKASVATKFRVGEQLVAADPASSGGFVALGYNPGSAETPYVFTAKVGDSGAKVKELLVAVYKGPRVPEYLNTRKYLQSEAGTLTNDTALAADAAASPGGAGNTVAQTSYTADPTVMKKRVKHQLTTSLTPLKGSRFRVYARVKSNAAAQHILQLRWGPSSTADPPAHSEAEVTHDVSTATAFGYVLLELGEIEVPDVPVAGVTLELWSRRASGTGSFNWDYLLLLPVEDLARIYVPGGSEELWLGKDLLTPTNPAGLTAGEVAGTRLKLDAVNEAGGTPPNAGLAWPVGRHRVTFDIGLNGIPSCQIITRVRNITDSTTAVTATQILADNWRRTFTVEFDSVAGKSYQPQAVASSIVGGGIFSVYDIEHEFTPYLGQNEQARTDPDPKTVHKLDSSANLLQNLACDGYVPVMAPPGLFAVVAVPLDVPKADYIDPEQVFLRNLTVGLKGAPRHLA